MSTQQPEALDLAYWLDGCGGLTSKSAAAELRRQHARITELEAQLEAVGAGGVGPLIACAGFSAADTNTTSGAADLRTAAQAVVDRWDTPLWKDVPATAEYIGRLRAALAAGQATAAPAVVQDDLITLRKPTTSAELLWLLKLAHLVISDVDKTLEKTFAPAQPAEAPRFGSPELQAMIIARCVEKDQADSVQEDAARYRWLRNTSNADDPSHMIALHIRDEQNDASLSGIDAAIDAARCIRCDWTGVRQNLVAADSQVSRKCAGCGAANCDCDAHDCRMGD